MSLAPDPPRAPRLSRSIVGQDWGFALYRPADALAWLQIPKCASNSVHAAMMSHGGARVRHGDWVKPGDVYSFAVVREPVERLASGIDQIARMTSNPATDVCRWFQGWLRAGWAGEGPQRWQRVDRHLTPQHEFVTPWHPIDEWVPAPLVDERVPAIMAERGISGVVVEHANEGRAAERREVEAMLRDDERVRWYLALDALLWRSVTTG